LTHSIPTSAEANRQIDLPHHQHAYDAQRNHPDRRAVEQQIHQVVSREKNWIQAGEHGPDDDQAGDDRERPQITRAHPLNKGRHGATDPGGVLDADIAAVEQRGRLRSPLRFRLRGALQFFTHDHFL
jgi:hypothetical protein